MTNDDLEKLLDAYDDAELAVQEAIRHRNTIRQKISGLTFRQAQRIARRGHWVALPGHVMGWRPYQLLDETKDHYVGKHPKAWTRKNYESRAMGDEARKKLAKSATETA